jgi:hypothetical protein
MQWEGVKQAREYLDELEKGVEKGLKVKEDWLKAEKAWLTYSIMTTIASEAEEQVKIIEGIVILLKEALAFNPANDEVLLRLGTIYFTHGEKIGVTPKQASV